MRPTHPRSYRVDDIATEFGLRLLPAGAPGTRLSGLAVGSGEVVPGDLFVALKGLRRHGAEFVEQALAAGARAVLTDPEGAAMVTAEVPVLVAEDPRALVGEVAAWMYGHPGRDLVTVAVTGTNGKTTTSYFVDAVQRARFGTTAVLGTVELRVGEEAVESPRTTVEAPVLHAILALARERGAGAATVEASSHALALHRTGGLEFDVAGFTNLQRDHLDFHGDMEHYLADKARLFRRGRSKRGVVVVDDEWGWRMAEAAEVPVQTLATRVGVPRAEEADWQVLEADIGLDGVGSSFVLRTPTGERLSATSPLPGLVNVSNAALAIVLAHRSGAELEQAVEAVGRAHGVPGRMERVVERGEGWPLCLVDYAHTPDALELALQAVRPITPGRLIIVFGSDGDRDQGKRPIMGQVAARLADVLVVTDENPRSEEPAAIRSAILEGVRRERPDGRDVEEVSPRAEAVRRALEIAEEPDTVIVTGKGHEPTQEIAGVFHRYNDRDVFLALRAERARA